MAFLTPDNIRIEHGLLIKEKIIPWDAVWPKNSDGHKKGDRYKADRLLSNGTGKAMYVTIHNTPDINEESGTNDAEQYTRATWPNANMGDVRVHYFIDETDCWQNLREDEVGWHAADGSYGAGNDSSIAIEIIMDGSGSASDKAAENRGALLAAILLNRHGLDIDRLTTHAHWYPDSGCPRHILGHWDAFVEKVEGYLSMIQGESEPEKTTCDMEMTILRRGMEGKKVKALQILLIGNGYSCGFAGADGIFGIGTENAVLLFQEDNNLDQDAAAGPLTMGALLGY